MAAGVESPAKENNMIDDVGNANLLTAAQGLPLREARVCDPFSKRIRLPVDPKKSLGSKGKGGAQAEYRLKEAGVFDPFSKRIKLPVENYVGRGL
jgi:hypothetical protein